MDRKEIELFGQLWQEVVEGKKKLDPVDHDELKGKHADRDDKDIDNDGDVDSSDQYLHKRRKMVSKKMKEDKDLDADNVLKALKHDCATHVQHEQWGAGECISGEHTLVEQEDGSAIVTHYDVMFEHGIEKDVPVEEMKVTKSEAHLHAAKKNAKKQDEGSCGTMNASYGMKKKMKEDARCEACECDPCECEEITEGTVAEFETEVKTEYRSFVNETRAALQQMWEKASQGVAGKHQDKQMQNQPQSAKDFADMHDYDKAEVASDDEKGHQDALRAAKAGTQAPARNGDKRQGDTKIVNPVQGSVQ